MYSRWGGSMSAAERMRRRRARLAKGLVHIEFWVDEANLTAKLIADRKLDPNKADDPKAVSAATQRLVEDMALVEVETR